MPGNPTGPPLAQDRDLVARYLGHRFPSDPVTADVVPYVSLLGVDDQLARAPVGPAGAGLVFPVHISGSSVVLGVPGRRDRPRPPCFHCVARRWQAIRPGPERHVLESEGDLRSLAPHHPLLTPFALEAIWQLARELLGRPTYPTVEIHELPYVYELDLSGLRVRRYPLVADAECPLCADPVADSAARATVHLRSVPKPDPYRYRRHLPAAVPVPDEAYVNPVCGVLGAAFHPDLHSQTTAPVTGAGSMRGPDGLIPYGWGGHADTYDTSRRLSVFEGLERYSGLRPRRVRPTVVDTYRNLADTALDPRMCGLYDDRVYAASGGRFRAFDPDDPIRWIWGYSLRDHRPILVPEQVTYYLSRAADFVQESSNGCATGSCLEEAILSGMLELIERDAFLLAWYGAVELSEIDPATCTAPDVTATIDRLSLTGYDVRLFDNRIDLPIPVVTGVAVRRDGRSGALCFAAGASFNPEDAVRGALCEVASYVPQCATDDEQRLAQLRGMARDFERVHALLDHSQLFSLPEMAHHADFLLATDRKQPMSALFDGWVAGRPRTDDLVDDIRYCCGLFAAAGFDTIVVDQTSPEQEVVALRTACVIVPGLIPIDFGWSQQRVLRMPRMRTAFRRAGWRSTDLDAAELNLVPHPFP